MLSKHSFRTGELQKYRIPNLEPILRRLNLQLRRQRCSRPVRFKAWKTFDSKNAVSFDEPGVRRIVVRRIVVRRIVGFLKFDG
jgi:hypothetical protein